MVKVFEPVKDEQSQKEFKEANDAASRRSGNSRRWLDEQEKTGNDNFALGPDKFKAMLKQTEGVDIDLAQLEEIGKKDLQRNLDAMKAECDKYAPGKTLIECSNKASAHKAEGTDVVAGRDRAARRPAQIHPGQRHRHHSRNRGSKGRTGSAVQGMEFRLYQYSGAVRDGLPSVYYVSPPDPTWDKKKQEEYIPGKGSLLFTSVHEVYPGHFVQFLHANRSKSKFGQVFVGYAFAEGWAHYCEEMMYDEGLGAGDPEMHIGQLAGSAASRCAVPVGDRNAYKRNDGRGIEKDVHRAGPAVRRRSRAAVGPRHVRPGLSQLHDGQADDPQAPR